MTSRYLYGANVHANNIRQHYLRYGGEGPPLIIVPGITSPAVTWGFVAERFAQAFDTYVLDVRGRGLSEASPDLDYGLDACAADVAALAQALGLESYRLVGHSMGGRIAVRTARRHPEGIERMVVVDPPVSGPGRRPYPSPLSWYLDSIRLMRKGAGIDELQLRLRAEWLHTCDEQAIIAGYRGFHEENIHADFPQVRVPTLLIAAGKGNVILDDDLDELKRLKPDMAVVRVAGAGHMIPWDDYEGFFRALGDFLGSSLSAAAKG
jgi:N-formylmaleamate deformylase